MTQETFAILLGLVVTAVTSLAKNPKWSRQVKTYVFIGVSAVAGIGQVFITEGLSLDGDFFNHLLKNSSVIIATATLTYNLYFKDTAVNKKLEEVGTDTPPE